MSKISIFGVFLFVATTAYADIDQVQQSGQWGAVCPPIVCSQPGDSWSYSFLTDSEINVTVEGITAPIWDFTFSLNGVAISALSDTFTDAIWFEESNDGGFALGNSVIGFGFWDALFTISGGPFDTIATLNLGVHPIPSLTSPRAWEAVFGAASEAGIGTINPLLIPGPVVITSAPEPSSVILLLTMLLGTGFVARKRVARATRTNS
jgi:hypothetical protein